MLVPINGLTNLLVICLEVELWVFFRIEGLEALRRHEVVVLDTRTTICNWCLMYL